MVQVIDNALTQIKKILDGLPNKTLDTGIRIYTVPTEEGFLAGLAIADKPGSNDAIIKTDQVNIYIDKSELEYLKYSEIEYDEKNNRFYINFSNSLNYNCLSCAKYGNCDYI